MAWTDCMNFQKIVILWPARSSFRILPLFPMHMIHSHERLSLAIDPPIQPVSLRRTPRPAPDGEGILWWSVLFLARRRPLCFSALNLCLYLVLLCSFNFISVVHFNRQQRCFCTAALSFYFLFLVLTHLLLLWLWQLWLCFGLIRRVYKWEMSKHPSRSPLPLNSLVNGSLIEV